jgi:hypothetical protein
MAAAGKLADPQQWRRVKDDSLLKLAEFAPSPVAPTFDKAGKLDIMQEIRWLFSRLPWLF